MCPTTIPLSLIRDQVWQENIDFNIDAIEKLDLVIGGNYYKLKLTTIRRCPTRLFLGRLAGRGQPRGDQCAAGRLQAFTDTFFFRTKEAWAVFADATFHATDQLSINRRRPLQQGKAERFGVTS